MVDKQMTAIYCHNLEQNTPEWHEARAGIPTASGMKALFTPTLKESKGKAVETYLAKLIAERIETPTGEGYQSADMERGHELEADARLAYEIIRGADVDQVGIVYKDATYRASCSPDGLIGDDGGLEIKCLKLENHIKSLLAGEVPSDHIVQCHANLWVTGRQWWDFMSYHPTVKPLIVRVERDEKIMGLFDDVVGRFCIRLDSAYSEVAGK